MMMASLSTNMVRSTYFGEVVHWIGKWKPKISYYDYYAQSQKKGYTVKQIFPYVKVFECYSIVEFSISTF